MLKNYFKKKTKFKPTIEADNPNICGYALVIDRSRGAFVNIYELPPLTDGFSEIVVPGNVSGVITYKH